MRTPTRTPPPPVRISRAARTAARERRRRMAAAILALVLAGAAWLLFVDGGSDPPGSAARTGGASRTEGAADVPAALFAISLRGAGVPLMAIVRTGGAEVPVLTIPADLTLEIPGLGQGTTATIADQDAEGMRVSLANIAGTWIDHYLRLDMDAIATLADAAGGLEVTLPGTANLTGRTVGPGAVTLSGTELHEYLDIPGPNAFTRWEIVLSSILQAPTGLTGVSDDLQKVSRLLPVGGEVRIGTFPTHISSSSARVPDYPALDALMARDFGVERAPVAVLVQNGMGDPGIGGPVAARLVPEGFRVIFSSNADDFDHRTTEVIAGGDEYVRDAQRARRALGVGVVGLTHVPSGVADITIVIGKDFTA